MKARKAVKVVMAGAVLCMACTAVWGARKVKRNTDTGSGSAQTQKAESYTGESKSAPSGNTAAKGGSSASPIVEQLNSLALKLVQDGKAARRLVLHLLPSPPTAATLMWKTMLQTRSQRRCLTQAKYASLSAPTLKRYLQNSSFKQAAW